MARTEFKSLFCERFKCASSDYEEKAFQKCLYFHARLLAPVIRRVHPEFFLEDFRFIGYFGSSTGIREATNDVINYSNGNHGNRGSWRARLKLRASGRKATRLVSETFAEARHHPRPEGARKNGAGSDPQER